MRAAVTTEAGGFEVITVSDPSPEPDQLVIRVAACGVCGSDLKAQPVMPPGTVMGHELGGEVVAVGTGTHGWRDGTNVAVLPVVSCGRCERCSSGDVAHCSSARYVGMGGGAGGFAELAVIPARLAFPLPDGLPRTYAALDRQTCEAARRALLSQGYVISSTGAEQVRGRKSFQPAPEAHAEVEFTVVCAKEGFAGRRTIAFVNAVQESFSLRKSNNSASVGLSPFGSLSLPFTGSDEALVKVGSATITSAAFYERFFELLERYLAGDPGQRFEAEPIAIAPAAPASAASGVSATP